MAGGSSVSSERFRIEIADNDAPKEKKRERKQETPMSARWHRIYGLSAPPGRKLPSRHAGKQVVGLDFNMMLTVVSIEAMSIANISVKAFECRLEEAT